MVRRSYDDMHEFTLLYNIGLRDCDIARYMTTDPTNVRLIRISKKLPANRGGWDIACRADKVLAPEQMAVMRDFFGNLLLIHSQVTHGKKIDIARFMSEYRFINSGVGKRPLKHMAQ